MKHAARYPSDSYTLNAETHYRDPKQMELCVCVCVREGEREGEREREKRESEK